MVDIIMANIFNVWTWKNSVKTLKAYKYTLKSNRYTN